MTYDIFIKEPIKYDIINADMERMKIKGVTIPLISLEHLIKLKQKAGRLKDLDDIANIREIRKLLDAKKKNKK